MTKAQDEQGRNRLTTTKQKNQAMRNSSDSNDGLDLVRINDLDYCSKHRLEVCGKCGYDLALTNRMNEIRTREGNSLSLEHLIDRAMDEIHQHQVSNLPIRTASSDKSGGQVHLPREPVQDDTGLNLSKLRPWMKTPQEIVATFQSRMSIMENIVANYQQQQQQEGHGGGIGSPLFNMNDVRDDVHMDAQVKEIFVRIALMYRQEVEINKYIRDPNFYGRYMIQDEKHTEGLMIDILSVYCTTTSSTSSSSSTANNTTAAKASVSSSMKKGNDDADGDDDVVPLIAIRYTHNTVSQPEVVMKLMDMIPSHLDKNRVIAGKDCDARTIRHIMRILDRNREKLNPSWRDQREKLLQQKYRTFMKLSYIVPLEDYESAAAIDETICPGCGRVATKQCTRCKKQKYCSRECQMSHWPKHKKICKKVPVAAAAAASPKQGETATTKYTGRTVVVDLTSDSNDDGLYYASFSLNNSLFNPSKQQPYKMGEKAKNAPSGVFAIKIQVLLTPTAPMMVYDRTRQFEIEISPSNCPQQFMELFHLIRQKGVSGGRKAYFNCTVSKDGKNLIVYIDEMLGMLPW